MFVLSRTQFKSLWLGSKYFQKHGSLEHSCRLSTSKVSILNFGELAYVASCATITSQRKMITSQVQFQIAKFKFHQYQNTTSFRHFTKFNARQIFPLYGNKLQAISLFLTLDGTSTPTNLFTSGSKLANSAVFIHNSLFQHRLPVHFN